MCNTITGKLHMGASLDKRAKLLYRGNSHENTMVRLKMTIIVLYSAACTYC